MIAVVGVWMALTSWGGSVAVDAELEQAQTFRLYDGLTVFVVNTDGRDFTVSLDVRDLNSGGEGASGIVTSELLFKVSDPDGKPLVREVIPDDGIRESGPPVPPLGWYYVKGGQPTTHWSYSSDPARLAALSKRTVTRAIKGGPKGIYQILLVGTKDLYVTLRLAPALKYAVAPHNGPLHGHGSMFRKSYFYVPRGSVGLYLGFKEYDQPETRRFTVAAPDGKTLFDGKGSELKRGADQFAPTVSFNPPGLYDDKLLILEVSDGPCDYLARIGFFHNQLKSYHVHYGGVLSAVLAPDAETARAVQGGAIDHDGQVFWHRFQVRYYDWLKKLGPEDFVVRDHDGKEIPLVQVKTGGNAWDRGWSFEDLPKREGYIPLCGPHIEMPLCDRIMHDYPVHKNRRALNVAIRDLFERPTRVGGVAVPRPNGYASDGLRNITIGDHTALNGAGGNLAYHFGTWGWPYWRAGWRILQQSDAPQEIKDVIREAFILCGDRLAFGRGAERVNGNAWATLVQGLRYCYEATGDPLQKQVFETYFNAYITEGFGERTGISKSGDCQESLGHDQHYGTYTLDFWSTILADLGDQRFKAVLDRIVELYTYTWCRDANANPWSSRTPHSVAEEVLKRYGFMWKGDPGPDFTVNVNGGGEWFAARRKSYYIVTFHGRLTPVWLGESWGHRQGYGGGCICQLTVPGKGTVIASTLNGYYGDNMELWKWQGFHLHSIVGQMHDGRPLVTADSEHLAGRLVGNVVSSWGEVRDCPMRATRTYTFNDKDIVCELQLGETSYRPIVEGWASKPEISYAYEMIPFMPQATVTLLGADGQAAGALTAEPKEAKTVVLDRGGYGVRVELDKPMKVLRGHQDTLLIQVVEKPTLAGEVALKYRLVPLGDM
ncbi:MAG: hypothetical protein HY717_00475 [Planctomycetes bacterium]|nr:hypothetical protein [Planctomycetota bacterium]